MKYKRLPFQTVVCMTTYRIAAEGHEARMFKESGIWEPSTLNGT